jgi:hypothetical protein
MDVDNPPKNTQLLLISCFYGAILNFCWENLVALGGVMKFQTGAWK